MTYNDYSCPIQREIFTPADCLRPCENCNCSRSKKSPEPLIINLANLSDKLKEWLRESPPRVPRS